MSRVVAVVLAAGDGKRMKSRTPKVLHPVAGRPLLWWVLRAASQVADKTVVVVAGRADSVENAARGWGMDLEFAYQTRPAGTGHALACALELQQGADEVLVLPADAPAFRLSTLQEAVRTHWRRKASATVLTATVDNPNGYGRIVRDGEGRMIRVVEEADATAEQRKLNEVNAGVYIFRFADIAPVLTQLSSANAQGEYYLPDALQVLLAQGRKVYSVEVAEMEQMNGVNDRSQLAEASAQLRGRILERLMRAGVSIEDPATTYVDEGVEVGADTVLRPLTFLSGITRIGEGCTIGPGTQIVDSVIGNDVTIAFSVVRSCKIEDGASVGPYAHLRPGTRLGREAKAGAFVELKEADIGDRTKVPHLSYLGDAEVGRDVNVGAGTITCNYDGETREKSKTFIEDGALIGADTMLVAPVRVGKDAVTGSGSIVTRDIKAEEVVAGVPAKVLRTRNRAK